VTGHESSNKDHSQIPWENYRTDDTIIFLMGLHRLKVICRKLMEIGKPGDYPVAVISRGTTADEKTVVGTLETIYEKAKTLPTPALIVVGEVVKLREQLSWFEKE
jgi:uroporphyrin-III C-methyltransferase